MKLTKNTFYILSVLLFVTTSLADDKGLVGWWKFDDVSQIEDLVKGNVEYVEGVSGNCVKTDGYTSFIAIKASELPTVNNSFTVSAWIALQTYPWNWTAIVDQSSEKKSRLFFWCE